jgi:hypothetical protein
MVSLQVKKVKKLKKSSSTKNVLEKKVENGFCGFNRRVLYFQKR